MVTSMLVQKAKFLFIIKLLVITSMSFLVAPLSQAAYTVKPKVGDCFLHTNSEVFAEFARKNPIPCSKRHNVEVYKVGSWPSETPPWQMDDEQAVDIAASVCGTESAFSRLNPDSFNYWAWFIPNKKQWAKGARWLRCDGMFAASALNKDDSSTWVFRTWSGKRL